MSRFLSRDIRDKVINLLETNLTSSLSTIDTARGDATPIPLDITFEWGANQYPLVAVDMGNSDIIVGESELTDDYDRVTEVFELEVSVTLKDNKDPDTFNHVENYIEAFIDVLHGYNDANITWIAATDTQKEDLYLNQNQRQKMGMVKFEARIN